MLHQTFCKKELLAFKESHHTMESMSCTLFSAFGSIFHLIKLHCPFQNVHFSKITNFVHISVKTQKFEAALNSSQKITKADLISLKQDIEILGSFECFDLLLEKVDNILKKYSSEDPSNGEKEHERNEVIRTFVKEAFSIINKLKNKGSFYWIIQTYKNILSKI